MSERNLDALKLFRDDDGAEVVLLGVSRPDVVREFLPLIRSPFIGCVEMVVSRNTALAKSSDGVRFIPPMSTP